MVVPNKDHFRVDEVAMFFDVRPRTVRAWIARGALKRVKAVGSVHIARGALLESCGTTQED